MATWLNGKLVSGGTTAFDLSDRGLLLGDGVFDTALVLEGQVVYRDAHLSRLDGACRAIGIRIGRDELATAMNKAAEDVSLGVVRVTVTRGPGPRGLAPQETACATVIASNTILRSSGSFQEVTLLPSSIRRNEMAPSSRLKTLGYLDAIMAAKEARDHGFDESLLLNTRDRVACAGSGNLFLFKDRMLATPPLEEGVMPGVLRAVVMRLAPDLGFSVCERPMSLSDVTAADAVFISNSLKLIAPVKAVGAHPISTRSRHAVARLAAAICADIGRACLLDPSPYLRPATCA